MTDAMVETIIMGIGKGFLIFYTFRFILFIFTLINTTSPLSEQTMSDISNDMFNSF